MGKFEGCGATPYFYLEVFSLFLGVVGGKAPCQKIKFLIQSVVDTQKHQGGLWFLYQKPPVC